MNAYLPASPSKILEVGALDVNGSLRDYAPRNADYVGLDYEAGKGVDAVITGLQDWNVPDDHFDLVIASSVFEHDPSFWKTFLAMCSKAKPGGHVYISAPSNGVVHRYPQDCWRFYPDAGLALEQFARGEGFDITLIESFVAERELDGWNDFCAIFRVGPSDTDLNLEFVHTKVAAVNAINWRSSLVVNPMDDPEDVRLLRRSREEGHEWRLRAQACEEQLETARAAQGESAQLVTRSREEGHEWRLRAEALQLELEALQASNNETEQLLSASRAEGHEWRLRHEAQQDELDTVRSAAAVAEARVRELEVQLAMGLGGGTSDQVAVLERQLSDTLDQKAEAEQRLHERFREIAGLTRLIQDRDRLIEQEHDRVEWLRQVSVVLTQGLSKARKSKIYGLLPVAVSHRHHQNLLAERGLFDYSAYISAYPDVAASGADPLEHYINHGIVERRSIGRGGEGR